ncbi:FAD/FMN-containing dehydrogenase [Poseidonocella pacifica]|uniref:FAD/FMN-containing dehydrogenase n=1 Tax=Poseidonocella pacifica TaxID=871651 RepID=A0A1I0WCD3_9RHOB|nr:FAD-binding oxidoreductase [Poseidonocella pacifica]SFA85673.1 FAD/FMN-containing dehydrogenase [Poseidonocella pacifica]
MPLVSVSDRHRDDLAERLPAAVFRDITPAYLEEPRGRYKGEGGLLLAPSSAAEVSTILRYANAEKLAVVPYGGGTGLVGGQVAEGGTIPIILSSERMTAIREVLPNENVMVVEAGAILQDIHTAAEAVDRLFPLSLAAKGSARIGGNLATNAGGLNVLRYGNARRLCLGLEVVLPTGEVWHGLTRLRKDNTGYDLRDLMIGSEGTLGFITAAALELFAQPAEQGTAFLVVESPVAALQLLQLARDHVGEGVSAFEIIHRQSFDFLSEALPQLRLPFTAHPEWSVLLDLGLGRGSDTTAALEAIFLDATEAGLVRDGLIARSEAQRSDFWAVRENIPAANRHIGAISSHDISLPLGAIPEFIERAGPALAKIATYRINCFGHVGDGNLHYNVFPVAGRSRAEHESERADIKRTVHDITHALGGSVSAEHGIGRLKVEDLERYADPTKLLAMRAIKSALDPDGIMNPGVILRT